MTTSNNQNKAILLADDNQLNRELSKQILKNAGFTIECVSNGEEVLDRLSLNQNFDLIILDINMPKINGFKTAKMIRRSEITQIKSIPIIAFTGDDTSKHTAQLTDSGINEWIIKPVSPEKLVQAANKIINTSPLNDSDVQNEINVKQGLYFVGNDMRIFKKLLSKFYENYKDYMDKLSTFVENNDMESLQFAVHNLKGTSAQICATNLHIETKRIEQQIKKNTAPLTKEDLKELRRIFENTMHSILSIVENN